MYETVFKYYRENNYVSFVNEANLMKALYELGFKLTKQTKEKNKEGVDEITQAQTYNFWFSYKDALREEILCQKGLHQEKLIKEVTEKLAAPPAK